MTAIEDLKAQVAASIEVEKNAIALINSIPDKVAAALAGDEEAKAELTTQLKNASDALQAAIVAQGGV